MFYAYASFGTRDKAESYLDNMFARGAVSECERPKIESHKDAKNGRCWWILYLYDTSAESYFKSNR